MDVSLTINGSVIITLVPKTEVMKNSTITVIQGNNNKSNIDKSETSQKAKDNSAIGQDNELTKTTKKITGFGYLLQVLLVLN